MLALALMNGSDTIRTAPMTPEAAALSLRSRSDSLETCSPLAGHRPPAARSTGSSLPETIAADWDEPNLPEAHLALTYDGVINFYVGPDRRLVDGLFVPVRAPLAPGRRIRVRLVLPNGYRFESVAVVEMAREPGTGRAVLPPGMGVRLEDLDYTKRRMIASFTRRRPPYVISARGDQRTGDQ